MKKLLILIIILLAAYFALDKFYPQILQKIPVVKQEKSDETTGWKTYRNEEFGFELKYPTEWGLAEYSDKNEVEISPQKEAGHNTYFYVVVDSKYQDSTLKNLESDKLSGDAKERFIFVADRQVKEFYYLDGRMSHIFIPFQGSIYEIDILEREQFPEVRKILSTFKFIK